MEKRLRILFVADKAFWPLNSGGAQRAYHILKGMARANEVTLLCGVDRHDQQALEALRPLCHEVRTFSTDTLAWRREALLPRFRQIANDVVRYCHPVEPVFTQWFKSAEAAALVDRLCATSFDVIWLETLRTLHLLPPRVQARIIVDLNDLEHRKLGSMLRHGDAGLRAPLEWLEFLKLRRFETNLRRLPYEFAVCSALDARILGGGPRIWVIPNGTVEPRAIAAPVSGHGRRSLLFVGSMGYAPNVDAVCSFVRRVLPRVRAQVPAVRFMIVGSEPTAQVQRLHDGDSVIVTGTVPDVEPYLAAAEVVVVPIRFGSGTRIKILEAMAHAKPIVSTTMGVEGIEAESGHHLLVADEPAAFANACVRLLQDRPLALRLAEGGRDLVERKYLWSGIERQVQDITAGRHHERSMGIDTHDQAVRRNGDEAVAL